MGYGNYKDPFEISPRAALGRNDNTTVIPGGAKESYTVKAGEKLELTFVVLPGESRDIDVAIDLVGEGAEVSLKGLYLCNGDERVNFRILMHHRAPGCLSRQL
jgi:ABC-type transport system involved in Fe-S cluster assembly, permease component